MSKILHVFTAPQSAYYFMEGQLQYLIQNGFDVEVILPDDGVFSELFKKREKNIIVHHVSFERNISIINDFKSLMKLIRLINKIKPDIVHLHTPKACLLGSIASRFLLKKIIIYQMHGLVSTEGEKSKKNLMYWIERFTCLLATHIFAVSNSLMEFAIEHNYCSRDKIRVINNGTINGIDFEKKFNPTLIQQHIDVNLESKFVVGFVGRITHDKGIFDYLKVVESLKHDGVDVFGYIVGPDESKGEFEEFISRSTLVKDVDLKYVGEALNPEIHMISFDILLVPTHREGFGLVAAEANALTIPYVGYDIIGIKDAVSNNETGILVKYNDLDALKEAVLKYVQKPKLIEVHGIHGFERVKKMFNKEMLWQSIFNEYESLLRK